MDEELKIKLIKFINSFLDILEQEKTFTGFGPPLHYLSDGENGDKQLEELYKIIKELDL